MKKLINLLSAILLLIIFFNISSASASISITGLIEKAKENDLKEVVIEGEIIGDIFYRGDFIWINVSDGNNAIGVWMPEKSAENLSHPGDYSHKGDFVQITGNFNRVCAEHIGETDIHSNNLIVLKKGENVGHQVDMQRLKITAGIFSVVIILFGIKLFLRKRAKKNGQES